MKTVVSTQKAPKAIGPYSQGITANDLIFVSGQLPIDPATGKFPSDDITDQTRQSLLNVSAILENAGYSLDDVVKTTVYLSNIQNFSRMNQVYGEFFKENCPARAAFQVAALPQNAKVEIEVIASH